MWRLAARCEASAPSAIGAAFDSFFGPQRTQRSAKVAKERANSSWRPLRPLAFFALRLMRPVARQIRVAQLPSHKGALSHLGAARRRLRRAAAHRGPAPWLLLR